ncbi:MAG: hypothetical protein NTX48_06805 [Planctomycetales bacterium]|nr:hypothetical protein [Planctomycetales bacterium]
MIIQISNPEPRYQASVSASGFTARVDFTAFRAARFRMGQPAGQKLSDGRRGHGFTPEYVMRDNDAKYSAQFDEVLKSSGAKVKRNTPMSPNL